MLFLKDNRTILNRHNLFFLDFDNFIYFFNISFSQSVHIGFFSFTNVFR